jgi:hypothetical protein
MKRIDTNEGFNVKKLVTVCACLLAVVAVSAPVALAQQSSVDGYGGGAGGIQSEVEGGGGGSLPFTGLDLGLLIGGGLVLLAVGFGLRRLARGNAS